MTRFSALVAALLIGSSAAALAHSNTARFEEQLDAIEQGRRDGTITWREGIKLRQQQAYIAQRRAQLLSDGGLSRKDRRELHTLQNKTEANITHEQNDRWHRLWWLPRVGK